MSTEKLCTTNNVTSTCSFLTWVRFINVDEAEDNNSSNPNYLDWSFPGIFLIMPESVISPQNVSFDKRDWVLNFTFSL